MNALRTFIAAGLGAAVLVAACDSKPTAWNIPNMTALSPRLQPLFEKTKTVCFGRFLIDVPTPATVAWGGADVPLGVTVYTNEAAKLASKIADREAALKAQDRYPTSKKLTLYFETLDGAVPGLKHIISQQDFSSEGMLRIDSFYAMGSELVELNARPLEENKDRAIATLNDIASRLRPNAETNIPTEPGVCIEHAFLPDKPGPAPEKPEGEHIRVGFRLAEFPDVHLSIYTAPANTHDTSGDSLEGQLKSTEEDARKSGRPNPFEKIKFFRRDKRQIHEWTTGFEVLTRTPDETGSHAHDDFWLKFTGVVFDVLKPYADIQLKTGVAQGAAGAIKPSLTDKEAIAVWDKLTSTIRVRPVSSQPVKTSDAAPPDKPLGELAATGRTCPHTGVWETVEVSAPVRGGRRQFFHAGDPMPDAVLLGKPNLLQRIKGDPPTHRISTVWKLVNYEAPAAPPASILAQGPTVADGDTPLPPSENSKKPPADKA